MHFIWHKTFILIVGVLTSLEIVSPAIAEIILPGRCHMGICWDRKFIDKDLLKSTNIGKLYAVKTAERSWKMGMMRPNKFKESGISYIYCSNTKPAYVFKNDGVGYIANLLNPGGGDWYGYNLSDYPVYWTACHNIIGPDFLSEEMTAKALKLGYPLNLTSEQIELKTPLEIME